MQNYTYDIVVIGGGNAALCAALSAINSDKSLKIALLESSAKEWRGGNSQHTRNLCSMHNTPTDVLTGTYSEDEFFEDVFKVTKRVKPMRNTQDLLSLTLLRLWNLLKNTE